METNHSLQRKVSEFIQTKHNFNKRFWGKPFSISWKIGVFVCLVGLAIEGNVGLALEYACGCFFGAFIFLSGILRLVNREEVKEYHKQQDELRRLIIEHYIPQLDSAKNKLYRKRKTSPGFTENLAHLKSVIEEVNKVDRDTGENFCYFLRPYERYYWKRVHAVEQSRDSHRSNTPSIVKENITPSYKREKNEALIENIDWKALGLKRYETGERGQALVVDFEKKKLKENHAEHLAGRVVDVNSTEGNDLGYDVLSFFPDGRKKYIEVKATTQRLDAPFPMSVNELHFMRDHPVDGFVYRVEFSSDYSKARIIQLDCQRIIDARKTNLSYVVEEKPV